MTKINERIKTTDKIDKTDKTDNAVKKSELMTNIKFLFDLINSDNTEISAKSEKSEKFKKSEKSESDSIKKLIRTFLFNTFESCTKLKLCIFRMNINKKYHFENSEYKNVLAEVDACRKLYITICKHYNLTYYPFGKNESCKEFGLLIFDCISKLILLQKTKR